MRRIDIVADHLQREIGLHGGGDVEGAVVIKRPAAMGALDAAQIDADLAFQLQIGRLAQIMDQQAHIPPEWWRRPPAHRPNARRASARARIASVAARMAPSTSASIDPGDKLVHRDATIKTDASRPKPPPFRPERSAPSMVAGRPVSVQSPARNRLRQCGLGRWALGVLLRRGGEGGALFLDDLPCGQSAPKSGAPGDIGPEHARPVPRGRWSTMASAPDTVTEMRSAKANIHSAVPPITPSMAGAPAGARCGNGR